MINPKTGSKQSLGLSDAMRLDSLCDQVREQIRAGQVVHLERILADNADLNIVEVFRELLPLEISQQEKDKRTPAEIAENLAQRFPQFQPIIEDYLGPQTQNPEIGSRTSENGDWLLSEYYIPEKIGSYEVLEILNKGGMGIVFKVRDPLRDCIEAIKVIKPDLLHNLADAERIILEGRFLREARAISNLNHAHIIKVHEVGMVDGLPFYRMDYIPGKSLAEYLAASPQRRLPCREACQILEPITAALAHAHTAGIIHRDIKPGNILLGPNNHPYLIDFGLAKWLGQTDIRTGTGNSGLGTLPYMSPEQIKDTSKVTEQSDIFSLGATLYEMVTGQRAFPARDSGTLLEQIKNEEPAPPRELNPEVDRNLETVIQRCLVKSPNNRYSSIAHLHLDLRRYLNHQPILARRVGWLERFTLWGRRQPALATLSALAIILALTALAAGIIGYVQTSHALGKAKHENEIAEEAKNKYQDIAEKGLHRLARMIKLHGNSLNRHGNALALLYFNEANHLDPRPETGNLLRLATALRQMPQLEQLLFVNGPVLDAALSPHGKILAASCSDGTVHLLEVVSCRPLLPPLRLPRAVSRVIFDHSGSKIATACDNGYAQVWEVNTGKPVTPPLHLGVPVLAIAFSPDDNNLLAGGGKPFQALIDRGHVLEVKEILIPGPPRKLPGGGVYFPKMQKIPIIKKGPPILLPPLGKAKIWDVASAKPVGKVVTHPGWITYATFSPDGRKVVTTSGTITGKGEAKVWDPQTGESILEKPLKHSGLVHHAAFSPEGDRLVTASGKITSNQGEALVWDLASGKQIGPALQHEGQIVQAEFSPDGQQILTAGWDQTARLWTGISREKDSQEALPRMVTLKMNDRISGASFNRNGKYILTSAMNQEIRLWDAVTGEPLTPAIPHPNGLKCATFDRSGDRIVTACQDGVVRIWDVASSFKARKKISIPTTNHGMLVSPSGKYLLVASGEVITTTQVSGSQSFVEQKTEPTQVRILNIKTGREVLPRLPHIRNLRPFCLSKDEKLIVLVNQRKDKNGQKTGYSAQIWDIPHKKILIDYPSQHPIVAAYFTPDGQCHAATIVNGTSVVIRNVGTGKQMGAPMAHDPTLHRFMLGLVGSPAFTLAATALMQSTIPTITTLEVDPRAGYLFTALTNGTGRVWYLHNHQSALGPFSCGGVVDKVAFHPASNRMLLATGKMTTRQGVRGKVEVIDFQRGEKIGLPRLHFGRIQHAEFSPDGNQLVTASADRSARVWDVASGKPRTAPLTHDGVVNGASFSRDGKIIATVGADGTARLWNVQTSEPVSALLQHSLNVIGMAFEDEDRRLITLTTPTRGKKDSLDLVGATFWDLNTEITGQEQAYWSELLCGYRLAQNGENSPLSANEEMRAAIPLTRQELSDRWHQYRTRGGK